MSMSRDGGPKKSVGMIRMAGDICKRSTELT